MNEEAAQLFFQGKDLPRVSLHVIISLSAAIVFPEIEPYQHSWARLGGVGAGVLKNPF